MARIAGTAVDAPHEVPRTALPKFRRPRYIHYRMRVAQRMAGVRLWWLALTVALCVRFFTSVDALVYVRRTFMVPVAAAITRASRWRAAAAAVAWLRGDADIDASITAQLLGVTPAPQVTTASVLAFLLSAVAIASITAVFALAMVGCASLCAWVARDFSGHMSHAASSWVWDVGTVGVHPSQALPPPFPRVSVEAAAAAAAQVARNRRLSTGGLGRGGVGGDGGSLGGSVRSSKASLLGGGGYPRRFPDSTALLPPTSLRVVLLTIGTRGDVQPYVALALALKDAGHDVVIASTTDFRDFVRGYGIEFHDTTVQRVEQPKSWLTVTTVAGMIRASADSVMRGYDVMADEFARACTEPVSGGARARPTVWARGGSLAARRCSLCVATRALAPLVPRLQRLADVVIGTAMTVTFALNISEAYGMPVWLTKLAPDLITRAFVNPGWSVSSVGWVNLLKCYLYWINVSGAVNSVGINHAENRWRHRMHLADFDACVVPRARWMRSAACMDMPAPRLPPQPATHTRDGLHAAAPGLLHRPLPQAHGLRGVGV